MQILSHAYKSLTNLGPLFSLPGAVIAQLCK